MLPQNPVAFNDLGALWAPHEERLVAAVTRVARSGWFILGTETQTFEDTFARWCGTAGCVGVANGTDALEIALRAVGVSTGDEVVLAGNAGGYGTVAALSIGAVPVVADVDPETLLIDPTSVAAVVTARTRAVIATHLYGNVVDMNRLRDAVGDIPIVEDCAQAHGASAEAGPVGSLGDVGTFSFYPTKNLGAVGDGGAIVSRHAEVVDRARSLHRYGWTTRYDARLPGGRNSRLDEMQAAVLTDFLPDLDRWNADREAIRARYVTAFGRQTRFVPSPSGSVVHLCVIRSSRRDEVSQAAARAGVRTEVHFPIPDHRQVAFAPHVRTPVPLVATEAACDEVLSVPCHPGLTEAQVDRVVEVMAEVLRDH